MIGRLRLWSQRRKLRGSLALDPLSPGDPAAWLDGAGSLLHLRTSCPHAGWLVHCAYWAELKMDTILAAAVLAAEHAVKAGPTGVFPFDSVGGLLRAPFPDQAAVIFDIERRHPQLAGIEAALPQQMNLALSIELGDRQPPELDPATLTPEALVAGGLVLYMVALFHRHKGLRESLVFACSGMATLFALGMPAHRETFLGLHREAYGWPGSMTAATIVK